MYFPDDMNFQYFFFSTYPGFFLQALPIALIAGGIYTACQIRRDRRRSTDKIILSALFVCYITGLGGPGERPVLPAFPAIRRGRGSRPNFIGEDRGRKCPLPPPGQRGLPLGYGRQRGYLPLQSAVRAAST